MQNKIKNVMKKILFILTFCFSLSAFGQLDTLDTGTGAPNSGEKLKTASPKINDAIIALNALLGDTVPLSSVAPMLDDTTLVFAQTFGMGMAGDTVLFSYGDVLPLGKWGGTHSLVITGVNAVVYGTTPDIDIALLFDANFRDGTPTEVFTSDLTVTSTTTGNDATINASNDTITEGTFLWLRVDQCTAQPTQCLISVYGYLE